MHRLAAMAQPDLCVITNIGLCHLENLGTRDGILQAKTECFDHLQPDGIAILNGDDDRLCTKQEVNGRPAVFYGFGEVSGTKNSVYATDVKNLGLEGMQAQIHTPQGDFTAQIPIPGEHNVYNALAGTAVGLQLGLTTAQIAEGIAKAQTIAGRTNLLHVGGMTVIDDCYNANPVSMKASIDVLAHSSGRRIAVLGDMGELGVDERAMHYGVGIAAGQAGIYALFCAGTLAEEYARAAAEVNMECEVLYFPERGAMTKALCNYVREGDTILVKASHFMEFPKVVEALCALAEKGE
jgi:UDP-N-acetylmuramoyl-tripeptide--D-alanyl-D-alanine ligase